ncbi:hypothetical protein HZC07_04765 [Candidatus Micrarchaeota archaeon]|nr:hypothetical protein [Candidatus Micrarchaeota archaeon]
MSVIKKSDRKKLTVKEAEAKIVELERAMLELRGEGHKDKTKPLKKAIAQLKTLIGSKGEVLKTTKSQVTKKVK